MNHILNSNGIHEPSNKGMVMFRGSRPAAIWRQYLTSLAISHSSSSYVTQDMWRAEVSHPIQLFSYSVLPVLGCGINLLGSKKTESPSSLCCATCMGNDSGISRRGNCYRLLEEGFSPPLWSWEHVSSCAASWRNIQLGATVGSFLQSTRK